VVPVVSVTHIDPPAVQTPGVPQQGSLGVPQVLPPADTQALAVHVPPPRLTGHAAPSAMQLPFLLQQPPPEQELSGQQRPPV
jgi:hypothetical protein